MLKGTAYLLASGSLTGETLPNAVLESFCIHLRALVDFLYSNEPRNDDAIAEDFMPVGVNWPERRPKLSSDLEDIRRRVAKEIVHLSYKRLDVKPEDKPWSYRALATEIELAFDAFIKLRTERLVP